MGQPEVLAVLNKKEWLDSDEIVERSGIDRSCVSVALKKLHKYKFIKKIEQKLKKDRRTRDYWRLK